VAAAASAAGAADNAAKAPKAATVRTAVRRIDPALSESNFKARYNCPEILACRAKIVNGHQ
jgi:hypothetical protein